MIFIINILTCMEAEADDDSKKTNRTLGIFDD